MNIDGKQLECKTLEYFNEICKIPRGSGNTLQISAYLENFASRNKLFMVRDEYGNVFIRREIESDVMSEPEYLLQAHMDMVCEKNSNVLHDFQHDPIKTSSDGVFMRAEGTTLGADDGVGMAIILALFELAPELPLEGLFTVDEEVGLTGAVNFDYGVVKARKMLNLDSENEYECVISCAGGVRDTFIVEYDTLPAANTPVRISVSGLAGGHSGAEIHLPRENAIRTMGRVLNELYEKEPFNLIEISGGMKSNAIPRECTAVVASYSWEELCGRVSELEKLIKAEIAPEEASRLKITAEKVKQSQRSGMEKMLTPKNTGRIISIMTLAPNGVVRRDGEFVVTSTNLGVIRQNKKAGNIELLFESRSSRESELDALELTLDRLAHLCGVEITHSSRYPGWPIKRGTELQNRYVKSFREVYSDREPRLCAIHAGLECGFIMGKLPDMDIISIGPSVTGAHTPDEKLELASVGRVCEVLGRIIG